MVGAERQTVFTTGMSVLPETLQRQLNLQHNAITAAQVAAAGIPRRRLRWLLDSGVWQRTSDGLYYAGRGSQPWLSRAWGAILSTGPDAVLGEASAARLHQLLPEDASPIQVIIPSARRAVPREGVIVTRSRTSRRTQTIKDLPCTTVPETIVDCAATLPGRDLEALIGRAFQRSKCNKEAIGRALAGRRTVAQRRLLTAAAADAAVGAHSLFEMTYLRTVERPHGLPRADRQVRVGKMFEWADVWYGGLRVIVELDGTAFHENAPFRDRARDNRNSRSRCVILRFGWAEVLDDPCGVALEVAENLVARGWDAATFTSCGSSCTALRQNLPREPRS